MIMILIVKISINVTSIKHDEVNTVTSWQASEIIFFSCFFFQKKN